MQDLKNAFIFPGQGSQYVGMASDLYNSSSKITLYDLSIPKSQLKENKVWTGYDLIAQSDFFAHLNKVGLLINHTSSIVDVNKNNDKINLNLNDFNVKIIFTPEHGFLGNYQAGEEVDYLDNYFKDRTYVFLSKHMSKDKIPAITAHFTGNFSEDNKFGGNSNEIAITDM